MVIAAKQSNQLQGESSMADATLTEKQAAELIRMLATDDDFRNLFENKPAKALFKLGIPAETIVDLNAMCLCPAALAGKSLFKEASEKMDKSVLTATTSMQTPKMSMPA